ncbi:MAG: translation initiation factor IF-3 [Candidatus Bipolaricaulis sp.]|nr:translation initiation factor IF-3 [Candidatus Bipolaricaulis sp.]MDD5219077.1 translation initiation factor IF-3 [Candidatus Bipolaricaulis sp.]MDD5645630.1 translation initiation factor IF-3 [Candidatus Bipolaricaulis sp.]
MRVNERIRVPEVRVVDDTGENLGVLPTAQAIALAKEKGLDLVEVAPQASPPVCRLVDFGKFHYQQEKKERKQKHRSKLKEVKFTIKIGEHDFQTKLNRVREFLSHGDMVRISIFFRGREIVHASRGHDLLKRVEEEVKDIARVEGQPMAKGKILQMMVVPAQHS